MCPRKSAQRGRRFRRQASAHLPTLLDRRNTRERRPSARARAGPRLHVHGWHQERRYMKCGGARALKEQAGALREGRWCCRSEERGRQNFQPADSTRRACIPSLQASPAITQIYSDMSELCYESHLLSVRSRRAPRRSSKNTVSIQRRGRCSPHGVLPISFDGKLDGQRPRYRAEELPRGEPKAIIMSQTATATAPNQRPIIGDINNVDIHSSW